VSARRRFLSDSSGAGAVEFAFVAPLLFAMLIGTVQLGWAFHCGSSVRYALEASARNILLNPAITEAQLKNAVVSKLDGIATADQVTVTLVTETSGGVKVARLASVYNHDLSVMFLTSVPLQFQSSTSVPVP
jgi:Flp pilus assembly protein TadG